MNYLIHFCIQAIYLLGAYLNSNWMRIYFLGLLLRTCYSLSATLNGQLEDCREQLTEFDKNVFG